MMWIGLFVLQSGMSSVTESACFTSAQLVSRIRWSPQTWDPKNWNGCQHPCCCHDNCRVCPCLPVGCQGWGSAHPGCSRRAGAGGRCCYGRLMSSGVCLGPSLDNCSSQLLTCWRTEKAAHLGFLRNPSHCLPKYLPVLRAWAHHDPDTYFLQIELGFRFPDPERHSGSLWTR